MSLAISKQEAKNRLAGSAMAIETAQQAGKARGKRNVHIKTGYALKPTMNESIWLLSSGKAVHV